MKRLILLSLLIFASIFWDQDTLPAQTILTQKCKTPINCILKWRVFYQ